MPVRTGVAARPRLRDRLRAGGALVALVVVLGVLAALCLVLVAVAAFVLVSGAVG